MMIWHKNSWLGCSILSLWVLSATSWADYLPNFFEEPASLDLLDNEQWSEVSNFNIQDNWQEKDQRYIGEDQLKKDISMLDNNFYQDDDFRFYNNTQYSFGNVKENYLNSLSQTDLEDLSISLGYGMEFKIAPNQHIGYEYLSSFPYDRGQTIRIFWKGSF